MNYFKLKNDLGKINEKMDWALKEESYQIEIFPQCWNNSTGWKEEIDDNMITKQTTYVVYCIDPWNGGQAYVFFDGIFAYKTEINNKFMKDLNAKSIAGIKSYWERYDMEVFKNTPSKYNYFIPEC